MLSRDEMIAVLVNDAVERVVGQRQVFWLQGILENGFSGFAGWSDEQLHREMAVRDLDLADVFLDEDAHAQEFDRWDSEDLSLLAVHAGSFGEGQDNYAS